MGAQVYLSSAPVLAGHSLEMAGFGATSKGGWCRFSGLHDSGTMTVTQCPKSTHRSIFCAGSGPNSRTSSCSGDSGSPWFKSAKDVHRIEGVNSYGIRGKCGDEEKESGVVRVASLRSWIESHSTLF